MTSPARFRQSGPALVCALAVTLIVFRTLPYLLFEQLAFDSDQAIVGLMAKHLSEGRAFPLFFYGQTYMLGVEAWAAVPFFWAAGPTVGALRWSLVAWNVAFALLLVVGLRRDGGLRWWSALAAALFFLMPPPAIAFQLINAQGGIIEPFVYVALLWFLRRRPVAFGALLAIGFRNREFTLYAAPVLFVLDAVLGEMNRRRAEEWLVSIAVFFAVWESIEALKIVADLSGPGTRGQLLAGFSGSQLDNLLYRFDWSSGGLAERVRRMGPELVAWFSGAAPTETSPPDLRLTVAAAGALLLAAGRLLVLIVPSFRQQIASARFSFYVLGVGLVSVAAFVAGKPGLPGNSRYVVLGLLIPVGLAGALLALERRALLRRLTIGAVLLWTLLPLRQNAETLTTYLRNPPPNPARQVADYLVQRNIPAAWSGYWTAYVITFLGQERVRVASSDVVRIQEYQNLFFERLSESVALSDAPCPGGNRVGSWYLCKP